MILSTIFTVPLEVLGLWLGTSGWFAAAGAAWALLGRETDDKLAAMAQRGAAFGFIVGSYVALFAVLYLVVWG